MWMAVFLLSPRMEASSSALAFAPSAPERHLSIILSNAASTSRGPRLIGEEDKDHSVRRG